jgi:two-component system cell cycle response regulator
VTLRTRLTLFFVGIVVLPLVAATLALEVLSARQSEAEADSRLRDGSRAVAALWGERLRLVQLQVGSAAEDIADVLGTDDLGARLDSIRSQGSLDFVVVSDSSGTVLAASLADPRFRPGVPSPSPEQLAALEEPPGAFRARVEVLADGGAAMLTGGRYVDGSFASWLGTATGLDVEVVMDDSVLASTVSPPVEVPEGGQGPVGGDRRALLVSVGSPGDGILLITPADGFSSTALWLVAAIGLIAATLLGWLLAKVIARPLERLGEGARRVAAGDLQTRGEGVGGTDVARVADAFNTMTDYLRTYIGELESSRDELRHNLDRMGGALGRTLDLEGMLEVILDTAAVTLGARAGALFLRRPTGQDLRLEVALGHRPPPGAGLSVGQGIAGRAARGGTVLVPGDDVRPATPIEPGAHTAVAVPLVRGDRIMGVIALYGRATLDPFNQDDAHTLASFAGQASVAIENVLLHQETQQMSITDGLTGVWNRRYLELSLRKEIERASRFSRPLAVLLVDIDRFKRVNDRFGHQRGDSVLVELTRRLISAIRTHIDFVARYGGEEFVLVLPETPCEGGTVVAEKLRSEIREHPFTADGGPPLQITVSVGVAAYPVDGLSAEELLRAADQAMYRAKRAGRDRVETASAA